MQKVPTILMMTTKSSLSHHHQPRSPPLHVPLRTQSSRLRPHGCKSMTFTIHTARNLKVVVTENRVAGQACKTPGVEFMALLRFEVLAFDAVVARGAETVVQKVVVVFAVWVVVVDVKVCGCEGGLAGFADEA